MSEKTASGSGTVPPEGQRAQGRTDSIDKNVKREVPASPHGGSPALAPQREDSQVAQGSSGSVEESASPKVPARPDSHSLAQPPQLKNSLGVPSRVASVAPPPIPAQASLLSDGDRSAPVPQPRISLEAPSEIEPVTPAPVPANVSSAPSRDGQSVQRTSEEPEKFQQLLWATPRFSPDLDAKIRTKYETALSTVRNLMADSSPSQPPSQTDRDAVGIQALDLSLKVVAAEFEQSKRNDTKAVACLAAVAVMASLTTALLPGLLRDEFRTFPTIARCALTVGVGIVLLCLARAARWALWSLRATWINVLGPEELVPPASGVGTAYRLATAATLIDYTIKNYEPYGRQAVRVDVALGCLLNAVIYMFLFALLSLGTWAYLGTPGKPPSAPDQASASNATAAAEKAARSAERAAAAIDKVAASALEATVAANKAAAATEKTAVVTEKAIATAEKLSAGIVSANPKASRANKHGPSPKQSGSAGVN